MIEIRRYLSKEGKDVFGEWLRGLKDAMARARIYSRLDRVELGNLGDSKPVGEGVHELRVDYGPGYRVYYGRLGDVCVLLLCGGDKRTQSQDIRQAIEFWQEHKRRK